MKWSELPKEIQERMLYEQELQSNPRDESVFIRNIWNSKPNGGFDWISTEAGHYFWQSTLISGKFLEFYMRYPNNSIEVNEYIF